MVSSTNQSTRKEKAMKARAAVNKVLGILAGINRWIWVSPATAEIFGAPAMVHYRYVLPDITDERRRGCRYDPTWCS